MYKKHITKVTPAKRRAVAPYNFIELPNKIVSTAPFIQHNQYICSDADKRYTGTFKCTLTTESPLYIRNGLTPQDFEKHGDKSTNVEDLNSLDKEEGNKDARKRRTDFFKHPNTQNPKIPGSSLRGMLRNLLEIISFSKIDKVSDAQKLFFRAVAMTSETDSIAAEYKKYIGPKKIKAGYLKKGIKGWEIQPAIELQGQTFAWFKPADSELPSGKIIGFKPSKL